MLNKLERKYGRYAVKDLTIKMMIVLAVGYMLNLMAGDYLTFNPYLIFHGQIWRIFTWVLIPMQNNPFLYALTILVFFLPIGKSMEMTWGDFKYNLYIFSGLIITMLMGLLSYVFYALYIGRLGLDVTTANLAVQMFSANMAFLMIPYFILMSIFFAYAAIYPNAMILFMFFIPIKIKWLAILDALYYVYIMYEYVSMGVWYGALIILASFINFGIFYLLDHKKVGNPYAAAYKRAMSADKRSGARIVRTRPVNHGPAGEHKKILTPSQSVHRCEICGKTDKDSPELTFRYCSKCKGSHEYCQEHLFTHVHIE
ncbi:hypothetical protein [Butyrivibrio sp. MC2013]|uniref:hypothetical protein n=1 Tax=Butyrivibrio sp. MC2013 TaxID=1280686 RepID=UPI0004218FB3|nr:hypothetical protein [Butyrivibrio sp. MC2013]